MNSKPRRQREPKSQIDSFHDKEAHWTETATRNDSAEPGLLSAFRLLILYWMTRLTANWLIDATRWSDNWFSVQQLALLLALLFVILVLITVAKQQGRLGHTLLPIALGLSVLMLLMEKYWSLETGTIIGATQAELLYVFSLQSEFALLLIFVAWQYRFWHVILYIGVIISVEWGLITWFAAARHAGVVPWPEDYVKQALVFLLVGYIVTWLMQHQRHQRQALATANRRLTQHANTVELLSITQERNRLARELHDTLAHSLSALTVQIGAIGRLWDVDEGKARDLLAQADQNARSGLQEARRSLQALRATPLEEFGWVMALDELAKSAAHRGDLELIWRIPENPVTLSPSLEQAVYRIAQEALENVVRHADAKQVIMEMALADNQLRLLVQDDGVGFSMSDKGGKSPADQPFERSPETVEMSSSVYLDSPRKMPRQGEPQKQWGLHGMHERAELSGGALEIISVLGQGTSVIFTFATENVQL